MKIILGADKDGLELKNTVKEYLKNEGFDILDLSEEPSEDFVEASLKVGREVLKDEENRGILFDLTGVGSFMAVSKIKGIIAAELSEERSRYMTREHNNAKVITIGSGIVGPLLAKNIVKEFLKADYAGGRHQIRVDMLNAME